MDDATPEKPDREMYIIHNLSGMNCKSIDQSLGFTDTSTTTFELVY